MVRFHLSGCPFVLQAPLNLAGPLGPNNACNHLPQSGGICGAAFGLALSRDHRERAGELLV
jgi:hypothetical protein